MSNPMPITLRKKELKQNSTAIFIFGTIKSVVITWFIYTTHSLVSQLCMLRYK